MGNTYKSEARIQQECYMWFHNEYPHLRGLFFHVPNGGARSAVEGKLFKLTGVVAGVADMLLIYKNTVYCFELKNKFGEQSIAQNLWQHQVETQGISYFIIRDLSLFQSIIKSIIK